MAFVLDASVAIAWCIADERDRYADGVLSAVVAGERPTPVVPSIWPYEVANALLMAERRKRISIERVRIVLEKLEALPIDVEPVRDAMGDVIRLAGSHNLSAYDAAYLELALRRGWPLATLDARLEAAAKSEHLLLRRFESGKNISFMPRV